MGRLNYKSLSYLILLGFVISAMVSPPSEAKPGKSKRGRAHAAERLRFNADKNEGKGKSSEALRRNADRLEEEKEAKKAKKIKRAKKAKKIKKHKKR